MDLETIIEGSLYTSDQSVTGIGLANIYNNLVIVNPDDESNVLNLKTLGSGTGAYSQNSYVYVQNNTIMSADGQFEDGNHNITAKEDTSAVYAPVNIQFPGSFKVKTIKSLWKDQTYAKNYAGMISMDSLFDYAKMLNKESTTTMYSDNHKYKEYFEPWNFTTAESIMDINSKFDGSAHIGATITDVKGGIAGGITEIQEAKANNNVLMDEDYKGSFNLTKKMAVIVKSTIDYGDINTNYDGYDGDYPWLPCACNAGAGWGDMTIHDQRYHSAKGFFDCTTCRPPGPCRN